ncbi:MAG: SMP-30/gluconolactonase/LRE family protein [Planctomycetota bacterium]
MANQEMQRSLEFAGYDAKHAWGDGGHNGKHATELFPEAFTWLWSDWPQPVAQGAGSPQLKEILIPGEGWRGNDVVANSAGLIFVTEPGWDGKSPSKIHCLKAADGGTDTDTVVDTGLKFPNGLCLSPDQSLLSVADSRSHWVYSYCVKSDGTLANKQRFYHLHVPDTADESGADGMRVDRDGRLWVATKMGIQVCDQTGRVNCIIPTPNGKVSSLCFGGPVFTMLLATCGDKVYVRKVKPQGAPHFLPPSTPAKPKL